MAKSHLVISMIELIRDRPGITIAELAARFGKSERTMYRWVNELTNDLHLPLQSSRGRYYLPVDADNRTVELTPQELLVLKMCLNSRLFGPGSPFRSHAESAWSKIRDAAPESDLESACDLSSVHSISVKAPPYDADPALAQAIQTALTRHCRLRAVYRSQKSDKVKDYVIEPYALAFRRHSWYVLAFSPEHDRVIQMRLGRFVSVEPTGETFQPPSDFSVEEYFQWSWEAWGGGEPTRVVVRFDPRVAGMIAETERHPTQVVRLEPDGSAIFEAKVSSIEEFAAWVMGYGAYAVVLEPEDLRQLVLSAAQGILDNYLGGTKLSPG